MKFIAIILAALMVLSLWGCRVPKADPSQESMHIDGTTATSSESDVIETKYYTLTAPEGWVDKCVIESKEYTNGGEMLVVREAKSYDVGYSGFLLAIRLVPSSEEYDAFPAYELLASLDTPDGSFYAVALFSDVVEQYSEETAAAYEEVAKDVSNVLYSIRPKEGVEMAMP